MRTWQRSREIERPSSLKSYLERPGEETMVLLEQGLVLLSNRMKLLSTLLAVILVALSSCSTVESFTPSSLTTPSKTLLQRQTLCSSSCSSSATLLQARTGNNSWLPSESNQELNSRMIKKKNILNRFKKSMRVFQSNRLFGATLVALAWWRGPNNVDNIAHAGLRPGPPVTQQAAPAQAAGTTTAHSTTPRGGGSKIVTGAGTVLVATAGGTVAGRTLIKTAGNETLAAIDRVMPDKGRKIIKVVGTETRAVIDKVLPVERREMIKTAGSEAIDKVLPVERREMIKTVGSDAIDKVLPVERRERLKTVGSDTLAAVDKVLPAGRKLIKTAGNETMAAVDKVLTAGRKILKAPSTSDEPVAFVDTLLMEQEPTHAKIRIEEDQQVVHDNVPDEAQEARNRVAIQDKERAEKSRVVEMLERAKQAQNKAKQVIENVMETTTTKPKPVATIPMVPAVKPKPAMVLPIRETVVATPPSQQQQKQVQAVTHSTLPLMSAKYVKARQQPKSPAEEARLQQKYAAISTLEERAFTILVDLGMVELTASN